MERMNAAAFRRMMKAGGPSTSSELRRQWQNTYSREIGQSFEEIISDACKRYAAEGVAYIEKTPEPMRPIRSNHDGTFLAIFSERAQCDYKGVLHGGRAVGFEAKFTDGDRMRQDRVTETQGICLDALENMGAACFVLAGFGNPNGFYAIPWTDWKTMGDRFGRKYATQEDLAPYQVTMRPTLRFLDGFALGMREDWRR